MRTSWYNTVRRLTLALTKCPSVTNTPGEGSFAEYLKALLEQHSYFKVHPDHIWLEPIRGDPRQRHNVFALVRGSGTATVVLTGHYDVVSTANYGVLEPWAFDPEALLPRLIADLRMNSRSESDALALADLESGAYLPGRGALDMKSGLAAGIAVLYQLAEASVPAGNVLLIATPDEEDSSYGMRGAALHLSELAQKHGLALLAAINLDATVDRGDGHEGQTIFLGSVGKLLPAVYIAGRDTHAGHPFDGINPTLLAAAITRRIECNVGLSDAAEGELAPPPTCLQQIDLKLHYDVTTPARAWCLFNVLSYTRTPEQLLTLFRSEVQLALDEAVAAVAEQGRQYRARTGSATPEWQVRVLSFAELKALALKHGGPGAETAWATLTQQLADDLTLDLPQLSRRLIEALWEWSELTGPAVVIGFASLYYPPVLVGKTRPRHVRLRAVTARQAMAFAQEYGVPMCCRPFYPGISDMSMVGATEEATELTTLHANTPPWGVRIHFDYSAVQALDLPVINLGPWGRDYHQRTERVYMPYAFGQLPELIWRIVQELLE